MYMYLIHTYVYVTELQRQALIVQWNLSEATTFGTKIIGCIRQVVLLCRYTQI